jgi:C4-dicarboxylate-specific signal transduction histidine kinase
MMERLASQIMEKPITPPLSAEEGVATILVNDLISERAKRLWEHEPYSTTQLSLDMRLEPSAVVRVSPEWLTRAFDMLVDNAVEAVKGQAVQKVTISMRRSEGIVEILVSDTGPGIRADVMEKLFLEPIPKAPSERGLGVGLLMAQTIVQTYGGEILVGSTGPEGTTMIMRLPAVPTQ